jgi:RNA polymerase sigma-70 factor (ECF subfamily)
VSHLEPKSQQTENIDPRRSLLLFLQAQRRPLLAYLSRQIPADLKRLIEPEDILQGVCFRASSHLNVANMPQDPDEATRWLMTIARNFLIDRVRELRAQRRGGFRLTEEEIRNGSVVAMLEDLAVYRRTPSASAAAHEFLDVLEQSLGELSADQQQAVRLRYVEGLSLTEAAAQMRRSEDSVQKLSARGLAALRILLKTASMYV